MAPVGSYESLAAAIQAGANSIYFGVENLNMRSHSANNFTIGDLHRIVGICKEHGLKSYLTVNTIIYDTELDLMRSIVDAAAEAGLTAIIACDLSVLQYARSKGVEVHASTQLNITNIEAVRFFAQYCDVVVTARELNLDQVAAIARAISEQNIRGPKGELVQIEVFAHGALCMAISGKCYLSLHQYGRSANRGQCFQPCRRGYEVTDCETGQQLLIDDKYIMSPKDLCTLPFLDRVLRAGVRVLKIEGRARGAEYVKTVVESYRRAIDAICDGTFSQQIIDEQVNRLKTVFNRGFWDGYYLGRRLGEWSGVYGSKATKRKEYVGRCTNFFTKLNVAEITLESGALHTGDQLLIMGETTGVYEHTISEMRVDLKPVDEAVKGQALSIAVTDIVRRGDRVYKLVDAQPGLME
ncbi:MAG: U32 family peptidase [Salinivirgaceae bacterium]|nr:U32 family peptidase [Salinivirgaceae bacterium]